MLISPDHRFVISHLGWVDKSSLWIYDVIKDSINLVPVGNAKYLSMFPCKDKNLFAVFHHSDGALIRLTIHSFDNPANPLCTIEQLEGKSKVEGDLATLNNAPRFYTAFYDPGYPIGHHGDFYLIFVNTIQLSIETQRFDWYDGSYDKGYQGIVGVVQLPSGDLIISVQRDSQPIVYDPESRTVVRKLSLANRGGNPKFRFANQRKELWADDYDTILKLDIDTLNVKESKRLQITPAGTAQFIGDWSFNEDESLCLVSRPFSGDAIAISTENLKTKYVARIGKQPIRAVFVNNGNIIGRDWKTGALLKGSLQRKWFG
jgi:hypothetical protein